MAGGLAFHYGISRQVRSVLGEDSARRSQLQFVDLADPPGAVDFWGSGEVEAVCATPSSLLTAGGFGVMDDGGSISKALPGLKVPVLSQWRGHPVAGLASGGLFLRRGGRWQEARSSFSPLQVRALLEGPGGELWVGARQGLFLAPWASDLLEQMDAAPVRTLALAGDGSLLAGGEQGLKRFQGRRPSLLETPDPWIDWVGVQGLDLWALTPLGLLHGSLGGTLQPVPGGQEVRAAVQAGNQVFAVASGRLLRFEPSGRAAEEALPDTPRRVFASGGVLFADARAGLYRKGPGGWALLRPRPQGFPQGSSHVNALAEWRGRVAVGLFDGGVLLGEASGEGMAWKPLSDNSLWGINALMPVEGVLYLAGLRGAARYDGRRLTPLAPGSAYALARGPGGVAVGYGHGVQLPDGRLLSAFHGLPGNQALALAAGEELVVGTPSGLGAIVDSKVSWRVTAGDGRLPNPWVTSLAQAKEGLYVGTYGGGVALRRPEPDHRPGPGSFHPFPETAGLKVNPGCLAQVDGRLYLGTDGRGLFRLSEDRTHFAPLLVALPSRRVTALLQLGSFLLVGTDEGIARFPLSLLREGS